MLQDNLGDAMKQELRIQQILTYARTFRRHSLILFGTTQISPYDLACNGFVNKNFKEEQKLPADLKAIQVTLQQVSCVCRVPQCMKNIRFNNLQNENYQKATSQDEVELIMRDHQEACPFYKSNFQKLNVMQVFGISHLIFDKINDSFKKDQHSVSEDLNISWNQFQQLVMHKKQVSPITNILLECYKKVDNQLNVFKRKFSKSVLLSVFGWKFSPSKDVGSVSLKCHFCGKKVQVSLEEEFDFFKSHNSWCLIVKRQYEVWKLMLKKKYSHKQVNVSKSNQDKKSLSKYILPRTQAQIESKDIRFEIYQAVKPKLQKIDQLLQTSVELMKKQAHYDSQFSKRHNFHKQQKEIENYEGEQFVLRHKNLDQISKKCKQIIRNFINSIQVHKS